MKYNELRFILPLYTIPSIASLLIEAGAKLDIPNSDSRTAIDYMAESENQEIQGLFEVVKKKLN